MKVGTKLRRLLFSVRNRLTKIITIVICFFLYFSVLDMDFVAFGYISFLL